MAISSDMLRMHPGLRNCKSVSEASQLRKEIEASVLGATDKAFHAFSFEMKEKSRLAQRDRYVSNEVRILSATDKSDSWLFFSINKGVNSKAVESHKTYLTLKDLNTLSPERVKAFMSVLQMKGYSGGLKLFQDIKEQSTLNDQIVMHGASKNDAENALALAKQFFGDDIYEPNVGLDQVVSGKDTSYSEILAARILAEVKKA